MDEYIGADQIFVGYQMNIDTVHRLFGPLIIRKETSEPLFRLSAGGRKVPWVVGTLRLQSANEIGFNVGDTEDANGACSSRSRRSLGGLAVQSRTFVKLNLRNSFFTLYYYSGTMISNNGACC